MANRTSRLIKGTAAAVAALWLVAAPQTASAQWWEDEGAYEENGFSDLSNYEDYGVNNEEEAGLFGEQYGEGYDSAFDEEEQTALGEDEREFWQDDSYAGYYGNSFEDEEWDDWF